MHLPFENLGPETILSALESVGFEPNGSLLALNSYENRVYQAQTETLEFYVAKFYRPERWTYEAIEEEHDFSYELLDSEISVVAPIRIDGSTIFEYAGYYFAIFPRQGGHPPNLENEEDLEVLSRSIARIHAKKLFKPRQEFSVARLGTASREFILGSDFLPPELVESYASTTQILLDSIDPVTIENTQTRIHGDCHMGNVLWRNDISHFVDFDDCLNGPPIQDLWMLLSGDRDAMALQLRKVLMGYEQFMEFDYGQVSLIEPLRTLRIINYAGWLAQRWNDPAFKVAFPWFGSQRYWEEHLGHIREQIGLMQEGFSI